MFYIVVLVPRISIIQCLAFVLPILHFLVQVLYSLHYLIHVQYILHYLAHVLPIVLLVDGVYVEVEGRTEVSAHGDPGVVRYHLRAVA